MELISKEDAVALIKAEMDKIRTHSLVDGTARINLRLAKNLIEDMPTIDIVRCKECKYYNARYYECECDWASTDHEGGASYSLDRNPDDFCSYGEREGE